MRSNRGTSSTSRDTDNNSNLNRSSPIELPAISPRAQFEMMMGSRQPIPSPYLTEAGHVLSLQQPSPPNRGAGEESKKEGDRSWIPGKSAYFFGQPLLGGALSMNSKTSEFADSSDETTKPTTSREAKSASVQQSPKRSPALSLPISIKPVRSFMGLLPRYHRQNVCPGLFLGQSVPPTLHCPSLSLASGS